jgi:Flp pilus assembly protein TadG
MPGSEHSFTARLRCDQSGGTVVEFAIVAPVFLSIVMFLFDAGYYIYARSVLSGEVNAAGRSSTLETATVSNRTALDAAVTTQVQLLVPNAQLTFDRLAFGNYGLAQARVEPFVDTNTNNVCDNGESYVDLNNNSQHDQNGGRQGNGGARDVVIYTVTMTYDRLFPVDTLLGFNKTVTLQATTLLKNQPFDSQTQPATKVCA